MSEFVNCSPIDFTIKSEVERLNTALENCENLIQRKKLHAEILIAGKKFNGHEQIPSIDPSDATTILGQVELANIEQAENALRTLHSFEDPWRKFPANERIQFLKNLGQIMIDKRFELTALIIREAGKPWKEADADVVEAIDFCFYYALLAEDLFLHKKLTQKVIGEQNLLSFSGRGLSLVIAPWNFPLAILCGMTVAALVSGNVTIIKPAEQTSLIGAAFAECLLEAGFPDTSFAFLPGRGEIVGRYLVAHSAVKLICFTGSKNVGLEIIEKAAHVQAGQNHIKRVIAELGGKNCIIVDSDADYDEALKGIIYSAFGFAGQKCSACSRLIVVGTSYETLMNRLAESCKDLIVGPASDPSTFLGPVVDLESQKRIQVTLASLDQEPFFQGQHPNTGCFIPATIYKDVSLTSKLWLQELFAPVLACVNVKTFDEALKLANSAEYALTGGVYSRSPKNIEQAIRDFEVGNLYINRACTGAIVCRHPFGGYKLSGIGSKAGGPDYLQQFVVPRTVSENTMRRGFTPELL
jgi:RHH-type proline utilization regulon transcriptional repressor/proline dehydrogenase/delta 1-pyrroline-5-carboxylate dehydrogenase